MERYQSAIKFIVLLGLVSLCGDIVYEGARSVTGPFFAVLGASATIVGIVAGLGEFLGYALRLLSGYFADRSKQYWVFTFLGYGVLLTIPLLALAGNWQIAALLLILERMGKGIRSPARDTLLSHATAKVGRGFGFGLHEALDQVGAIVGPLAISAVLYFTHSYRLGFALLAVPVFFTLFFLTLARTKYPTPTLFESTAPDAKITQEKLSATFWLYLLFTFFSVAGFVNFQLISYHFELQSVIPSAQIPVFYALAMGVDAIVALIIGKLYDRIGLKCLFIVPFLTIFLPFFAFSHRHAVAFFSVIFWGAIMGIHETIMRAATSDLTPLTRRATAYGIFNTAYGLAWFVGSSLIGLLYGLSIKFIIGFVLVTEGVSLFFLWQLIKKGEMHA
ncbi:MAG: MFS transporter [Candidatus Desulfofervidaceae bacterium]|nr:MFS transporter [Candidatus Desulfofervidaceae bacterium]